MLQKSQEIKVNNTTCYNYSQIDSAITFDKSDTRTVTTAKMVTIPKNTKALRLLGTFIFCYMIRSLHLNQKGFI